MLILLSPSKSQDFETPAPLADFTLPGQLEQSQLLIAALRQLPASQVAALMSVSEKIAQLNTDRYRTWQLPFTPLNAKQCAYAFTGDVYDGLDARSLDAATMQYAQARLRILSGLYGALKPLDLIQPYRLEMKTRLANARGKDLYAFWGSRITDDLQQALSAQGDAVVINLASGEYFSAVRPARLKARIIAPVFLDRGKSGDLKIISFFAKRARGLMARYLLQNRITTPADLTAFALDGYQYDPARSTVDAPVFTR